MCDFRGWRVGKAALSWTAGLVPTIHDEAKDQQSPIVLIDLVTGCAFLLVVAAAINDR